MNDRQLLLEAFLAGVAAVDPASATERAAVGILRDTRGRVLVIAAGKGSVAMARGLARAVRIDAGVVVAPEPGPVPTPLSFVTGGHPVPNEGSVEGARRALEVARSAGPRDFVVCLISGGASALLAAPADGLTLGDLRAVNRTLLTSGADISEINTIRKHLSGIKGGRLAEAARAARLVTLILSDVAGDRPDVIASGPTAPDPTSYADALRIVDRYGMRDRLPEAVIGHLAAGDGGTIAETPKHEHPAAQTVIIGSGSIAAEASVGFLRDRGVPARVADSCIDGEARDTARRVVGTPIDDTVLVYAGETTVKVTGHGTGGRNQEAALAGALAIEGQPIVFLAAGTDGVDGPTAAAGGLVDGGTISRGNALGLDASARLTDNDAHTYLAATGDLVVTGPTGTNVADLWLVRGRPTGGSAFGVPR